MTWNDRRIQRRVPISVSSFQIDQKILESINKKYVYYQLTTPATLPEYIRATYGTPTPTPQVRPRTITVNVSPTTVKIGDTYVVSGYVREDGRGVSGAQVSISVDGLSTSKSTDASGYYEARIASHKVGTLKVTVTSGTASASASVTVQPRVTVPVTTPTTPYKPPDRVAASTPTAAERVAASQPPTTPSSSLAVRVIKIEPGALAFEGNILRQYPRTVGFHVFAVASGGTPNYIYRLYLGGRMISETARVPIDRPAVLGVPEGISVGTYELTVEVEDSKGSKATTSAGKLVVEPHPGLHPTLVIEGNKATVTWRRTNPIYNVGVMWTAEKGGWGWGKLFDDYVSGNSVTVSLAPVRAPATLYATVGDVHGKLESTPFTRYVPTAPTTAVPPTKQEPITTPPTPTTPIQTSEQQALQRAKDRIRTELEAARRERNELWSRIKALEDERKTLGGTIYNLRERRVGLEAELLVLINEIASSRARRGAISETDLRAQIERLRAEVQSYELEAHNLRIERDALRAQLQQLLAAARPEFLGGRY